MSPRLNFFGEVLGLRPLPERLRQTLVALRGSADVPPSRADLSSLSILGPRLAFPLWIGRPVRPRTVVLTNLFNHRQTPFEEGWSTRCTQLEDFRGRKLTYDSHNGTDLAIPVGTPVLAAAPGVVVRVVSEFNRGGLKIFLDHGRGLMTNCAHLARALVREGDVVRRGQQIAWSGYSGLDGASTFPWGIPHVHFNTWLNGAPVDPFPRPGETPIWIGGHPRPAPDADEPVTPAEWRDEGVDEAIATCRTPAVRARLAALTPLSRRAPQTVIEMNYYPTRFTARPQVYAQEWEREERLSLPFPGALFDRVVFADEL